ncbi:MAG: ribonuclease III [Lysobacterales bacterium CG02_land_8_20_14_3_00_62_12]|nr:MAG: ribonuclease III [Xanthomonadales bacterium CG02_land_8_20_14_3_00_62_12]
MSGLVARTPAATADWLNQALTHRSVGARNNERLEFLGDALVNFIVAEMLFERFPKADEGVMTRLRASLVRETALAGLARRLALGDQLKLGPGEMKSGGHRRDSILADALEAVAAAHYLGDGWDSARTRLRAWFEPLLANVNAEQSGKDGKTELQEWLQARGLGLPNYQLLEASGPDHAKTFTASCQVAALAVAATASGDSRKLAEIGAAKALLQVLEKAKDKVTTGDAQR